MIKYRIHLAEMGEASPTAVIEELYCKDGDTVEKDQGEKIHWCHPSRFIKV
jgi:hypothetical protein